MNTAWQVIRRRVAGSGFTIFLCAAMVSAGCVQGRTTEQRVVELPAENPNATLSTAGQIGQAIIGNGFFADVQEQFPNLTEEQFGGLFINWSDAYLHGKRSVFFTTGIRYTGSLPGAKAVADYCESVVKQAVTAKFSTAESK